MKIIKDHRNEGMCTNLTVSFYSMDDKVEKNVTLRGNEVIFDVIRILFLNEEITILEFEKSYKIFCDEKKIDPNVKVNNLFCNKVKVVTEKTLGGLVNLGNTCFMNSSLQGLFAYKEFVNFLCNDFIIAKNNPLGSGGKLVKALSNLIQMLKSSRTVRPEEFKRTLFNCTNKYGDYQEQDAPEFISILLDKIHEDLNISADCENKKYKFNEKEMIEIFERSIINERIIEETEEDSEELENLQEYEKYYLNFSKKKVNNKIKIENTKKDRKRELESESDDIEIDCKRKREVDYKTEREVKNKIKLKNETKPNVEKEIQNIQAQKIKNNTAIEIKRGVENKFNQYKPWIKFLSMNNSFIGKNFYGLLHSKLRCVNCSKESKRYDPFLFLTLSIPKKRTIHPLVIITRNIKEKLPMKINVEDNFSVGELKDLCKIKYGITEEILVISFKRNSIEILEDEMIIKKYKKIFLYEYEKEKRYVWFTIKINSFIFLNNTFEYLFLIEVENSLKDFKSKSFIEIINQKLEPFIKNYIKIEKYNFKENIKIENKMISETNYPLIILNLKETVYNEIFGSNFKLEENIYVENNECISLEDCSDAFFRGEYLSGENSVFCTHCNELCSHMKKMDIYYYPKYLIITLKRFSYDYSMEKIKDLVNFQEWFTMENINYKLKSVCNHIELGFGSGHYTTYSKREDEWYCFNDSVVSKLNEMKKEYAYILFYERE